MDVNGSVPSWQLEKNQTSVCLSLSLSIYVLELLDHKFNFNFRKFQYMGHVLKMR